MINKYINVNRSCIDGACNRFSYCQSFSFTIADVVTRIIVMRPLKSVCICELWDFVRAKESRALFLERELKLLVQFLEITLTSATDPNRIVSVSALKTHLKTHLVRLVVKQFYSSVLLLNCKILNSVCSISHYEPITNDLIYFYNCNNCRDDST